MLIKCPKCRSVYDLPDNLMPAEGLKMRCANCQEVWVGSKKDALKIKKQAVKDIQQMFDNVSKDTAKLFVDKPVVRMAAEPQPRTHSVFNWFIPLIILAVGLTSAYIFRYDAVRLFPGLEKFYNQAAIESIYYGRNLEFKDIRTREFSEDNIAKLEISGKINNNGIYTTIVPPVKLEVKDQDGLLLSDLIYRPAMQRLGPDGDLLFNIILVNPTPHKKSIYLTFQERLSGEK